MIENLSLESEDDLELEYDSVSELIHMVDIYGDEIIIAKANLPEVIEWLQRIINDDAC